MWRYTPSFVKLGPFDGRLFAILLLSLLFMPVIGHYVALIISLGSLIVFWFVEQLGLDVNMVFRWLRCWAAGNYHTSAGAMFDQPRRSWTTLPVLCVAMIVTSNWPGNAMAAFQVTDQGIADKVAGLSASPSNFGYTDGLKKADCDHETGVIDMDDAPRKIASVKTRGNNVPLRTALKAILPKGWHASKSRDVDGDMPLSWEKGESFTVALASIAYQHDLSIQVSWKNKNVHVAAGCEKSAGTQGSGSAILSTKVSETTLPTQSPEMSLAPALAPEPLPKAKPTYMLLAGQQMSEALREWCQKATESEGVTWTLIWEAARDQAIEANSYYGEDIESAITQLQNTIIGNNIPLRVYQWNNHVIKVTN